MLSQGTGEIKPVLTARFHLFQKPIKEVNELEKFPFMTNTDLHWINQTNQLARNNAEKGFDPFAAILVHNNQLKASTADKCVLYADPTAHAELILISEYCRMQQLISLEGYTLYTNVEPCVMCSGAIHWAKLSRVVFGLSQAMLQKKSGGKQKPACDQFINIGGRKIDITGPIVTKEGQQLFRDFPFLSKAKRQALYLQSLKETVQKQNNFYCAEILSGSQQAETLWESPNVLAFKHTKPYWELHWVIIPKQHISDLTALDHASVERDLFCAIQALTNRAKTSYGGCRVSSNIGNYQSTKHLHFYIHAGKRLRAEDGSPII